MKNKNVNPKTGVRESVNESLWRGELTVSELVGLLNKMPEDAFVRVYANKLQVISPVDLRTYTLDAVR
jgi:hypothetical protein